MAREQVYTFQKESLRKRYPQKKIRLVFTMEAGTAVAVMAFVYYGQWEE